MSSGIFRYDLSDVVTRPIPGHFGFIVQRNSKRRTHRRTPAKMLSLQQPYDPTVFNFNLINDKEVRVLMFIVVQCLFPSLGFISSVL